jgi:hypothetical protein
MRDSNNVLDFFEGELATTKVVMDRVMAKEEIHS